MPRPAGIQAAGLLEVTIDGQMAGRYTVERQPRPVSLQPWQGWRPVPRSVIEGKKGLPAMADAWEPELLCKGLGEVFI